MFEEKISHLIQVLETGQIQVRRDTIILKNGVEVGRTGHRFVLEPGDDLASAPERVQQIAGVVWTPAVISARKATLAKANADVDTLVVGKGGV